MKLRKIELSLEGDEFWPKLSIVHVPGVAEAQSIANGMNQPEAEEVIRSWNQAAILKVTPADGGALVGFWVSNSACEYLNVPVEVTNEGLFAMRVGGSGVDFFVLPQNHKTNYSLELVEMVNIEDPKYSNVCLY
jgi:hypothetical protein